MYLNIQRTGHADGFDVLWERNRVKNDFVFFTRAAGGMDVILTEIKYAGGRVR